MDCSGQRNKEDLGLVFGILKRAIGLTICKRIHFYLRYAKGFIEAMRVSLPESNHRYCVKHIESNWCKRWRSGEMKKLLWRYAWSTYEKYFQDQLKNMGNMDEDIVRDLLYYPPQSWCRAYFDIVCKNMAVDNNYT